MLRTLHDSDTNKDWNPIYVVVNRPRSCNRWSVGWVHDDRPPDWQREIPPEEQADIDRLYGYQEDCARIQRAPGPVTGTVDATPETTNQASEASSTATMQRR